MSTRAVKKWRIWLANAALSVFAVAFIAGATLGMEYGANHSWLFWVEHWTSDWRSSLLSKWPDGQHSKIAIVKVDEDTMQHYPYRTPIDRGLIARLIQVLDKAGAQTIAIDFLFLKTTEPDKDEALVKTIKSAKARVVLAAGDSRANLTEAQASYQRDFIARSGAMPGYANLLTGADQIVRFVAPPADGAYPKSFAVAAAKPDVARADGPRRIAWLLQPKDGNERFLALPAHLLAAPADVPPPPTASVLSALLKDRIVFIGADLIGIDRHLTPLASWTSDGEVAGILLHAHIAAQLIDGRAIERVHPHAIRVLYALLTMFGLWIGLRYGFRGYSIYFGTATLMIAGADILIFIFIKQFLPFTACILIILLGLCGGVVFRQLIRQIKVSTSSHKP